MAMWIAYELMLCKKRGKLFDQIVKILYVCSFPFQSTPISFAILTLKELKKLNNYQTAMSIYLGLHLNPVTDILEEVLEYVCAPRLWIVRLFAYSLGGLY
jgi:hypothetical protein